MPSPFPGMDPFLEGQLWPDFHHAMIEALRSALVPLLHPGYIAVVEERVYLEHLVDEAPRYFRPDVAVARGGSAPEPASRSLVVLEPVPVPLSMPERVREGFLEIRRRDTREVITVVEVLSPANKRLGSDGRREYLAKREAVLQSLTHLVELDLLRGGERLPMARPLPPGDYYVVISRSLRRPMADVWPFTLQHRLPVIPIPLAPGDPDVPLDLQEIFQKVYDSAGYGYSLDYRERPDPDLPPDLADWVTEVLKPADGLG